MINGNAYWAALLAFMLIGPAATTFAQDNRMPTLEHVSPARDSVGAAPKRFEWTPVKGAESYAIGVWTEFDVLWWRTDNIPTNSVVFAGERAFEPGTYYWSVTAVRGDRAVADSGMSAFVVRQP